MFKRANKVTALLVAAASVMSLVPAMAATRIGTKDGHIKEGAIAFTDGKYLYDGYRTNDDDNGIYYNGGTEEKEKFNEDLRDYTITSKYGTKYAYANDGADQYLIDLSTGKIVDDETPEDKADQVKSTLKSKLKKTDRYAKTGLWDSVDLGDSLEHETDYKANTRILGSKFGEVWYMYTADGDQTAVGTKFGQTDQYATFTVKLPVSDGTTQFQIGTITLNRVSGESLNDFKARILKAVKGQAYNAATQPAAQDAGFLNVFDVNTIVMNDAKTEITGRAITIGDKTNDTAFKTFVSTYGGVLGATASVDTKFVAGTDLNLTNVASALSSDQAVVTSTTTSGGVTISRVGLGKATLTVKDTDAVKVATIDVTVTTPDGIKVTKVTKYYSEAQKTAALINITAGAATLDAAAFDAIGLGEFVTDDATSTTKLTIAEAKEAIQYYIAHDGKLGALTGTLSTDQVKVVLQAALNKKTANIAASTVLKVTAGQNAITADLGTPGRYIGYVNEAGKYIDVSNLANVYVYSKNEGKTIKIKEYNKRNADFGITVGLQSIKTLAQDKDYIYALVQVGVLEDKISTSNPTALVESQYFIQKISKAQGDDKDGAYVPKSVDSYQVDSKKIFDNGDSQVAYNLLVNNLEDGFTNKNVSVKDGALYVTGVKEDGDHDKVKVFKIALKKDKNDLMSGVSKGKYDGKDVDVYIAKKDADTDMDIKEDTRDTALAYDVDGNTWVVSKGTITKITGTDKKEMYTCDRTFDHIDVYDDKNLIVWDKDSDVYSNVGEGTKVTQGESTAVAPVIVTGWVKGTDGTWTFNDATGTKVVSKWQNIGGYWYYLKADGIMATGWYKDGDTWYYLNPSSGAMVTGWLNDNGTWYYLAGSGAMLSNTVVDGYTLGGSGAWVK